MKIHTIQLNIEAFESGTMHMDATEKGVYMTLLICLYKISTHKLPNNDARLARMAGVTMRKWKQIKPNIIDKFMVTDSFWEQKRVCEEVLRYTKMQQKNKANALKTNKTSEPLAMPLGKPNASQKAANTSNKELITSNNKDKDKEKIYKKKISLKPDCVSSQVWGDFELLRKSKKAAITKTALNSITNEANKINWTLEQALTEMCARSWQGFKAEWVNNQQQGKNNANTKTRKERLDEATARGVARAVNQQIATDSQPIEPKLLGVQRVRQIT